MHILFVEDNPNVSMAIRVMLELKGHRVDLAATVHEAGQLIAANDYDLLISDIHLPDGTGHEILSRAQKTIRAIALSGDTSADDRAKSLENGFAYHLSKPFQTEELLAAIEKVGGG